MACTTSLSKFGYAERVEAIRLLTAWNEHGLPKGFSDDQIEIILDQRSGWVFLTNANYEVAIIRDGKLEMFYHLPESGFEGFLDELVQYSGNLSATDQELLDQWVSQ